MLKVDEMQITHCRGFSPYYSPPLFFVQTVRALEEASVSKVCYPGAVLPLALVPFPGVIVPVVLVVVEVLYKA